MSQFDLHRDATRGSSSVKQAWLRYWGIQCGLGKLRIFVLAWVTLDALF